MRGVESVDISLLKKEYMVRLEHEVIKHRKKKLSLRDIAEKVGVSHMEVKRVLLRADKSKFIDIPNDIYADDKMDVYNSSVYFIRDNISKRIKIGTTTGGVEDRMARLTAASPISDLEMLFSIEGDNNMERCLHRRFKKYRLHGEWFEPAQEILDYIKKLKIKRENEID